jgi:hypothetical protein
MICGEVQGVGLSFGGGLGGGGGGGGADTTRGYPARVQMAVELQKARITEGGGQC